MNYKSLLEPISLFSQLKELSKKQNTPIYVVGGFVRDALLGKSCKDIDIVCLGDSIQFAETFSQTMSGSKVTTFKNFGTAMVQWKSYQIEFVHARKESYTQDSRKPTVQVGTLEEDIMRRDFTINTLAISLNHDDFGELIDLCNGLNDLHQKCIRTPLEPEKTFSDDPLRMLRGIRFAVQLGFDITTNTLVAMQLEAERLHILSKERIITELNNILLTRQAARGLQLLDQAKLLPFIIPEMEALKGKETINGLSHKDNFIHTLQVVENVAEALGKQENPKRLWLIWAAILHDIAKPKTKKFDPKIGFMFHGHEKLGAYMVPPIFRRLGLPMRQEMHFVKKLVRLHLRHIPLVENEVTDAAIRRFLHDAGQEVDDLLILCKADITSGNPRKRAKYAANFDILAKKIQEVEEKDHMRNFTLAIDGDTIMKTFNIAPCREIGFIKEAIKEAVLSGKIANEYESAHPYMIEIGKSIGLEPIIAFMTNTTAADRPFHEPVMLKEAIDALDIKENGTYVDLTFGGGGHAQAILEKLKTGSLWAFDQDPDAVAQAQQINDDKLYFIKGNFRFFADFLHAYDIQEVDGILVDLGVSSHQFDTPQRGFAVRLDGPLDMRMHQEGTLTAAQVLNTYSERELISIFAQYGDIARPKPLVAAIVNTRIKDRFNTVAQFKQVIAKTAPRGREFKYYAKVFQALRITVNREQEALHDMLQQVPKALKIGGRFVAITYHSGEDRPIKNFIKAGNISGKLDKDIYGNIVRPLEPTYNKRGICPTDEEIARNNRARSARLRVATALPPAKVGSPCS